MAALVSRIKSRVRPGSGSEDFATASSEPAATQNRSSTPSTPSQQTTPARGSLENSAFHVTRAGGVRASSESPEQQYSPRQNASRDNRHSREVNMGEQQTRAGEQLDQKSLSRYGQEAGNQAGHKRNISLQEQEAIIGELVPERDSSKHAHTGQPARGYLSDDPFQEQSATANSVMPERASPRHGVPTTPKPERRRPRSSDVGGDYGGLLHAAGQERSENVRTPPGHGEPSSPPGIRIAHNEKVLSDAQTTKGVPIPPRKESLQSRQLQAQESRSDRAPEIHRKPLPSRPKTQGAPRQDQEPGDIHHTLAMNAQLAQEYLASTREKEPVEHQKVNPNASSHLKLPLGFDLQNTEQTQVIETQRPTVTHETIIEQRTEIIQEAITRDIHVHHYYTYLQPIKVVEVLPPRHFFLDLETGTKTEISQPSGWQLPPNMAPVTPDTSMIKAWTRHYLVDEEHPNGLPEPPPLKHEQGHSDLRKEALAQQSTAFV